MASWYLRSERYLPRETIESLEGRLCLGLVNTHHPRTGHHVRDALTNYRDLVAWIRSIGMLTEAQEQHLLLVASAHPQEARSAFDFAIAIREATYRAFSAIAGKRAPKGKDLSFLHGAYVEAMARSSLSATTREFSWGWEAANESDQHEELKLLLWPLALSALELLTTASEWDRIQGMSRLWVVVSGLQQDGKPPMVQHGRVRKPRKDATAVCP